MSHFFAFLFRMKFIQRWGLMRNVQVENVQEHSHQVAVIAHALAIIRNRMFNGAIDPNKTAVFALYHDLSEVLTGDLPAPIKYDNPEIKTSYKNLESVANKKLFRMLPNEFKADFAPILNTDPEKFEQKDTEHWDLVKAADKIAAYIKCIEELKSGNDEFVNAKKTLENAIVEFDLPEVNYFMSSFIPSFKLTLDELSDGLDSNKNPVD